MIPATTCYFAQVVPAITFKLSNSFDWIPHAVKDFNDLLLDIDPDSHLNYDQIAVSVINLIVSVFELKD